MADEAVADDRRILAVQIAEKVREESRSTGKLSPWDVFFAEPDNLQREEAEEVFRLLGEGEGNADIRAIRESGSGKAYLYASPYICETYAATLLLAETGDPCRVIAQTVREESQLYPRPTCSLLFHLPPYELSPDALPSHLEEIRRREEMQDIRSFQASTGVLYLYSERHMSLAHARGLAEWVEVEQFENQ